jgi:hypothetical protein
MNWRRYSVASLGKLVLREAGAQPGLAERVHEEAAEIADALVPRLVEELAARTAPGGAELTTPALLTLDQLVAALPKAKKPETWKRWLYERTRRGEVPGCVKLGGMLFFEREPALAWLRAGAVTR